MNAIAHSGVDGIGRSSRARPWTAPAIRALPAWMANITNSRAIAPVAWWACVSALGMMVNTGIDFALLRAQVALACAALSGAIVLAERWSADPDRIGRGCALATIAAASSACAALV